MTQPQYVWTQAYTRHITTPVYAMFIHGTTPVRLVTNLHPAHHNPSKPSLFPAHFNPSTLTQAYIYPACHNPSTPSLYTAQPQQVDTGQDIPGTSQPLIYSSLRDFPCTLSPRGSVPPPLVSNVTIGTFQLTVCCFDFARNSRFSTHTGIATTLCRNRDPSYDLCQPLSLILLQNFSDNLPNCFAPPPASLTLWM